MGGLDMISSASPSPQLRRHTIGSAVFAQMTVWCPYALQWAAPPQNYPFQ